MSTENTITAPKPPRSEAQQEAARRNGAKSRGPVSPMGKVNSSRNALTHGLTAFHLALSSEDHEAFNKVLADYKAEYRPTGTTETNLVEQIAFAQWCMYRAWTAETAALNIEIETNRAALDERFTHFAEPVRVATALESSLARTASLPHLHRCAARVTRDYFRALKMLRDIRKVPTPPTRSRAKHKPEIAESTPGNLLKTMTKAASSTSDFAPENAIPSTEPNSIPAAEHSDR